MSTKPGDQTESLEPSEAEGTADFRPATPAGAPDGDTTSYLEPTPGPDGATADLPPPSDGTGAWQADLTAPTSDVTGAWQAGQGGPEGTADYRTGADVPSRPTLDVPGVPGVSQSGTGSRAAGTNLRRVAEVTGAASVGAFPPAAPQMRTGHYHLKKFHAKGGMGEIWLAEDIDIGRHIALKKMRGNPRDDQKDQFLREAQITGQLEHPGVVPIHELSIDEAGQPYYIMKFIQGQTLTDIIQEYHAPPKPGAPPREVQGLRLLQVFLSLCQTIAYAHSRGVIHRDIKPDNVMVGAYGETLVLDWGLAKSVGAPEETTDAPHGPIQARYRFSGESLETMDGAVKGTPSYMAPEVAEGRVAEVDQASDIYLLGGTLYHILTGKKPREAKKIKELLELARNIVPTAPRKLDKTVPRALEAICMKALALRKEDRYASAAGLAEDVQRYLAGEPVSAYRESFWERSWRWVKRHRVLLGRTAAALLLLGLVGFGANELRKAEEERIRLQQEHAEKLEKARLENEEERRQKELVQKREQAKMDAEAFDRLADDAQRLFALQQPGAEQLVAVAAGQTERKAGEAVAQLSAWGPTLADFPLPDRRGALKQQLYEVLLLQAEAKSHRGTRKEAAKDTLALLDRAAALRPPTAGHLRLWADCQALLGDKDKAADARRLAAEARTPRLALDHFLAAERLRAEHAQATGGREKQAWARDQEKLFERALDEYREAVKQDYRYFWAHFQLGQGFLTLHKEDQALNALDTCVAVRPNSPWGYAHRGYTRAMLRRFADARKDLERAIELGPLLAEPIMYRGLMHWLEKKYDDALEDFHKVLALPPAERLIEAALYRGQMYLERREPGDEDRALADFTQVIDKQPRGHIASQRRARIYLGRGDIKKGMGDLNAFLDQGSAFDPESAQAYARRGQLMRRIAGELPRKVRKGVLGPALDQLNQAVKRGAQSYQIYDELGAVLSDLARVPEAIRAFTRATELAPAEGAPKEAQAPLWRKLGWKYEELNQLKDSAHAFAKAIELDPQNAEGHAGLGYIQACLGQSPAAATSKATEAALLSPGDWLQLHNVACVYGKLAERAYKGKEPKRAREYEDVALVFLRREVELWGRDRTGGDAPAQIRIDPAFPPEMRERAEFNEIIKPRP